ncbi:MAG: signal peptidase II [Candidatus Hydrothermales bacterium]
MSDRDREKNLRVIIKRTLFSFSVAFLVFLIDHVTKILALTHLEYGVPLEVLGPYFRFTLVFNPYGIWGLPITKILPYEIIAILAIFILILFIVKEEKLLYNFFYGLILGGALGNLYDRLRMKAVIDFIEIGISENLHWPIFNLADTFITIGIIGTIFFTFIKKDKK